MRQLTLQQLQTIMPRGAKVAHLYLDWLNKTLVEFGIQSEKAVEAFLAQIAVESNHLTAVSENLNYSAEGLANTWPARYAAKDGSGHYLYNKNTRRLEPNGKALLLHRNPIAIANHCYAGRLGNGDEASGDGWRFRGAGFIQTTGKANQLRVALHFDIDPEKVGDWLRTPEGACRSAGLFWRDNGLSALAEAGKFTAVSQKVNGGDNGRDERLAAWGITKEVIS
jgi:putative chitinase